MKKIILAILVLISIIAFQSTSLAEDVGVSDIVFEEETTQSVEHGFLINELSYTIIKLHLTLAGKNIETVNYQGETLATIKRLEELTKTDVVALLNLSINKEEVLAKYLTECDQELQK